MAPIKRKGNAPEETAVRQPQKRAKVGAEDHKNEQKPKDTAPKASELSVLRDDEPSFPRGGGSVLTPLERKQIQIQAHKDVLFEQKGPKKQTREFDDNDEDEEADVDMEDADAATTKKSRKKKSKGKKSGDKETKSQDKEEVRVEPLTFKRIVPGSMLLGQVSSINANDIALSLPNNLVGYVPLTAVSKGLDDRIEKMLNEEEDDDDSSDEISFDLKDHFYIGQYLRAYVVSTGTESTEAGARNKKRLELSIDPRQTNSGLSKSDLVAETAVQASVVSVEDHGLVMDLGIEGSELRGFMSSREIDSHINYSDIKEGSVFLCLVTGQNASGNVVKLSANLQHSLKKSHFLAAAPTINSYLPGVAAEILLTEVTANGMIGKIMGMLDTTVDLVQSGVSDGKLDLVRKFKIGAKIKGRIVSTFPSAEPFKVGFSMLDHVLKLSTNTHGPDSSEDAPAISAIIPETKVVKVDPGMGVYAQIGETKKTGFVHISRLSDGKIESISDDSGPFRVGSTHEARVVGYNKMDDLYLLSYEKSVIEQPFIRIEDVTVGALVKGKVEKLLVGATGMDGLIVSLADGITGLVPSMHFADTKLQFPEKKFREGLKISARILSVNLEKRQIRLTLKKSLLNSESAVWKDYKDIVGGAQSPGTIVSLQNHGAVVQFYGDVRGFLPVSEMSEAYIKDPAQHFRLGQVVNVHALSVDAAQGRLAVSCKDPSTFTDKYRKAFEEIHPGLLVAGTVFEKSNDDVLLKLDESGLVARLDVQHIIDGSPSKQTSTLSKIRVGQKLNDLLVLDIQRAHRLIRVSSRASLKKAVKQKAIPTKFEDVQEGSTVTGFIRNITPDGLFVEFLGGLTGLLPKRLIEEENLSQPQFGVSKGQVISLTVHSVDLDYQRFILSQKESEATHAGPRKTKAPTEQNDDPVSGPVDENIKNMSDFTFGRIVKCKVTSVKSTQVNVQLADNIQGRIDVSEVFDKWDDLEDRKHPLRFFKTKQIVEARILGIHDARNHKFLPISHRSGKYPVYELSLKPSFLKATNPAPLNLEQVQVGSSWMGFINNISDNCIWINLSPSVRGRLRFMDASDDLSLLTDVENNFPIGSALKVQVTGVNAEKGQLDLSAKQGFDKLSFGDVSVGMIVAGRVTKVTEKQVIMQLSEAVVAAVNLIDMADDYSKANPSLYRKNEILRAYVVSVDEPNKKIQLSLRPSKVLSSTLPVQDREITSLKDIKPNEVIRGFVKRVTDAGLFVSVGRDVIAYVRVSDLSDAYLKEWKDAFQVDQLVKGRVTMVDASQNKLQLSLKDSLLDPNYKAPVTLRDLKVGQVVTGKIRKVEEFGAFIVVDKSSNVSGLCHRSEMADKRIEDARTLYDEGDNVKAKIIKIDPASKKISFSLKASHFQDAPDESDDEELSDAADGGVELQGDSDDDDVSMGGVDVGDGSEDDEEEEEEEDSDVDESTKPSKDGGLGASGFDWSGNVQPDNAAADSDSDEEESSKKKKKSRKPEIQVDRTGELDANGPQTVADYERLLMGEPDSSLLWLQYMAFQLELGEVEKARTIAERALRTISMGQESEKLNVWIALLNLENTYGNDDTLEEVFNRACQYQDAQVIYDKMASIYISSGKNEKADDLFRTAMKKKIANQSPAFFLNYASFLFDILANPERGRGLLARALQSLPTHTHVETTSKFAQLEFRSANGDIERGRTVFEGLLSSFPKRIDLWNVLIDLEIKNGDADQVRRLFERVLGLQRKKGSVSVDASKKLKPKQAKFLFKKWLAFEEKLVAEGGDEKMVEETKARAAAYVKSLHQEE